MGRPSIIPICQFAKVMPEFGYRIVTFVFFYFCMLFAYRVIKLWLGATDRTCFWICVIYATLPTNDSRIVLSCFPYSVGIFFFMAGFSYLVGIVSTNSITLKNRVASYCLFLISFFLNSNLCFYAIVLLMILTKVKNLRKCIYYADYVILPIVFFTLKSCLFPAYGLYANYNTLTFSKIVNTIRLIVPTDFYVFSELMSTYFEEIRNYVVLVIIVLALYGLINMLEGKKWKIVIEKMFKGSSQEGNLAAAATEVCKKNLPEDTLRIKIEVIVIGFISLSLGLFPYVAVRQSYSISTVGLNGRDTILIAFGAAMLIYGIVNIIIAEWAQKYIFVCLIFGGIVFFNIYYLSYQQDYYRQLGFQYQLSQNMELKDAKNIVYVNSDPGVINIQSFYSLNGNAEEVFGTQDKFIVSGTEQISFFDAELMEEFISSGNYHMSDYDVTYKKVDAIVEYSFDTTLQDTIKMKIYEIFRNERFDKWIQNRSSMDVYMNGTEEYKLFLRDRGYDSIELK